MIECQEAVNQLILDIHSAPLDPGRWQSVVTDVCRLVSADKASLFSAPLTAGMPYWNISYGLSPESTSEYAAEFVSDDIWTEGAIRRRRIIPGTVTVGEALCERCDFVRTRFYNEFLARHDIDRLLNLALLPPASPASSPMATFSLYRGVGKDSFGTEEQALMRVIAPHLVVAINTYWRLGILSRQERITAQSLDAVNTSIIVIDRLGRILFANVAGESALRTKECLQVTDGILAPSPAVREWRKCKDALKNLCHGQASNLALTRATRSGEKRVVLSTAPFTEGGVHEPWGAAAGLVWLAPGSVNSRAIHKTAQLFGLTAAEENVLRRLADGIPLAEIAEILNISVHTARTHIKSVQLKTGWHTQAQLVRMVQRTNAVHV